MPWLYDNPHEMNYEIIDLPIRELIKTINDSGWLFTEESCSGHPANEPSAWGPNKCLYIRFVVSRPELTWNFLWMIDLIRESYSRMIGWHVALTYDCQDELGSHWYMNLNYGDDISNRAVAVDIVLSAFSKVHFVAKEVEE